MSDKSTKKADDDDIEMSLEPTSEVKRPAASSGKEAKETKEVKDAADGKEAKPSGKEAKTDEGREVKVQEEVKGLDIDENQSYTLVSSNKAKFTVPARFIKQSDLLISMVEGDRDETELPLPRASEPALARVVEYMKHHDEPTFAVAGQPKPEGKAKPIAKPLKSNKFNEYVSDWDYKFVTKLFEDGQELYFDVVLVCVAATREMESIVSDS